MRKRRFKEMGRTKAFLISVALSLLSFLAISFIAAVFSDMLEDSRAGAERLTLVCIIISGFTSGFISRKLLSGFAQSLASCAVVTLIFALTACIASGYSLGAFMNELTYLLLSVPGALLARERKKRRRAR